MRPLDNGRMKINLVQTNRERAKRILPNCLLQLHRTNFWNWNIEARDAFFDGIMLGLSTCSALCANNDLTFVNALQNDVDDCAC